MFRNIAILAVTMAAAMLLLAGTAMATVTGSPHDLTTAAALTAYPLLGTSGQTPTYVCEPCHAPHNTGSVGDSPLGNHTATLAASWTPYSSTRVTGGSPGGGSKLCLGCHDGSVAIDSFGGTTGTSTIAAAFQVGAVVATVGNLTSEHPIGIAVVPGVGFNAVPATLPVDSASFVQCSTCHNPHDQATADNKFLRLTKATLCIACHIK